MPSIQRMIAVLLLLAGCAVGTGISGQSSKGIVVGTVEDSGGAVIGGATAKVTNMATNVTRETITSERGTFRLDAVEPGLYKIEITAAGFKTLATDNVPVAAGQITNVPFKLEIGTHNEIIQVSADSTVTLQTQDGARTSTIDARQITDLPTASTSTSPLNLVFTLPGVVSPGLGSFGQGVVYSINGNRSRGNNSLIDGTDNNDSNITGQSLRAFLRDGYQEVAVLGGNNSAEYGRAGGAVTNLVTKSGTNQFHGSVYDLITPSALSSLSSGNKLQSGLKSVPVSVINQYGFSLGGPIRRDKLFFFTSLQFYDSRAGSTPISAIVPTADGFSLLRTLFPQGRSANLDYYLGIVGNLRGTTAVRPIQLGGGRPNINFGIGTKAVSSPFDDRQLVVRVDFTPPTRDTMAFRYISQDQTVLNRIPSAFDGLQIDAGGENHNFLFTHTHTFSPTLTNEFRVAYSRAKAPFFPADNRALSAPFVGITGVSSVGLSSTFPQNRVLNNYQYQDTVTWTVGNHTFRFGADLNRQLEKLLLAINDRGTLGFTAGGGFPALGNFIDGFSGTQGTFASIGIGNPVIYPKGLQQAYFVNDSWRVKSNLTLNLGLRYENFGTPFNSIRFPAFAGFNAPLDTVVRHNRDDNNFAPRFSFAYTPRVWSKLLGQDKTVIRGGYGLGYDVFFNNILFNTASGSPNVVNVASFGSSAGGRGFAGAGLNSLPRNGVLSPLSPVTSIDRNLVNPMVHTWNLGVQREVVANIVVDAAYVGSRGTRLFFNEELNPGLNGGRVIPTRGAVTVRGNGADSVYHSLQTRVERGFRNGLFTRFAYTFSKAIDNNSEVFVTSGGSSRSSNLFNRSLDRSVATFDAPHAFAFSWVWDVPGPKSGVWGQVAGGWSVAGFYNIQTGAVETAFLNGFDINRDLNGFNDRPAIGNPNAPANSVAILASLFGIPGGGYVDANGIAVNPANTRYVVDPNRRTNLVGRNTLRADRTNVLNISFNKSFKLPFEGHKFELRIELFNAFNHPNFTWDGSVSSGDVFDPNFNNVKLNDGGNRTGRVQIRYSF